MRPRLLIAGKYMTSSRPPRALGNRVCLRLAEPRPLTGRIGRERAVYAPVPEMVCGDCAYFSSVLRNARLIFNEGQKKLTRVITPDPWKDGARNTAESGGRKVNENKLLTKNKRFTPLGLTSCRLCKGKLHDQGLYCQTCAYKRGICSMCGKKVLDDVGQYKQSVK